MLLFLWLLQLPSALRGAIDVRAQRRTRPVRCSREVPVIVSSLVPPYLKGHKPSTQSPPTRKPEAIRCRPVKKARQALSCARATTWSAGSRRVQSRARTGGSAPSTRSSCSTRDDLRPCPTRATRGIRALLEGMIARFGWEPILEDGNIIALKRAEGEPGGNISLEPGGQFELSGAPLATLHETAARRTSHLDAGAGASASRSASASSGSASRPSGRSPRRRACPRTRYAIMTRYMPKVGTRGLDMMYRTCTVQVNLDFADEADMVKKLRVVAGAAADRHRTVRQLALHRGPASTASSRCRSEIWLDTDRARTGMLPFAFEPGMGFERYVDYALDVPMYFVYRGGRYIDAAGASFRTFMAGQLPAAAGRAADARRLGRPPDDAVSRRCA